MARHMVFIYECEYCGKQTEPRREPPKDWRKLHGQYDVCEEHVDVDFVTFIDRLMRKVR